MSLINQMLEFTDIEVVEDQQVEAAPSATRAAAKDILPFAAGLVPFSLAIGAASASAGLSAFESIFGAAALMAGTSQLAAIDVIASGGGLFVTVAVIILINLRFVLYGAGVARWFRGAPLANQLALSFAVVDQTFLLCQERFTDDDDLAWRQRYYMTATGVLITVFLGCQLIAYQVGAGLPTNLGLGLAAPLAFGGMLAKSVKHRNQLAAAVAAAAVVVLGSGFLGAASLPVAAGFGVLAGMKVSSEKSEGSES